MTTYYHGGNTSSIPANGEKRMIAVIEVNRGVELLSLSGYVPFMVFLEIYNCNYPGKVVIFF